MLAFSAQVRERCAALLRTLLADRKHREAQRFRHTNGMMHSEMMSELRAGVQELSDAHVRRALPTRASPIENFPSVSEVIVKPLHGCAHPAVSVSVFVTERRQCFYHDYASMRLLVSNRA